MNLLTDATSEGLSTSFSTIFDESASVPLTPQKSELATNTWTKPKTCSSNTTILA